MIALRQLPHQVGRHVVSPRWLVLWLVLGALPGCVRAGFDSVEPATADARAAAGDATADLLLVGLEASLACPGSCTSCEGGICALQCPGSNPCVCPAGWPCRVSCPTKACRAPVDCTLARGCEINCTGQYSCKGTISCGEGLCIVRCSAGSTCQDVIDGSRASQVDVTCSGHYACVKQVICGKGPCQVRCSGASSCRGGVDGSRATSVAVGCTRQYSCAGALSCGTGSCSIHCAKAACKGSIDCSKACGCHVDCTGGCSQVPSCPPACGSCTSSGVCDQCP